MNNNKKIARLAGFLYFIFVLTGIFSLLYVPSQLIDWADPIHTAQNIMDSEPLFRWGILSESIGFTIFLPLVLVLYKLLKPIHKTYAIAMVALAVPSIPVFFSNLFNKLAILSLIKKATGNEVEIATVAEQVMFYLEQFNNGNLIGQNFWALWLFPFGYLVYTSNILPKILGIFLMVGSVGYFLDFAGKILLSNFNELGITDYLTLPASIGEIGICLWMLIMGAKENRSLT